MLEPSRDRLGTLEYWYRSERPALLRFAISVTADRSLAEELVQETFVAVGLAGGRIKGSVQAYARATLLNIARSKFRRKRVKEIPLEAAHSVAAAPADPPDDVWAAMKELSPRQRAVIHLRFYEDLREKDVAEMLGMSVGSVKKHTDRALNKMRGLLEGRTA